MSQRSGLGRLASLVTLETAVTWLIQSGTHVTMHTGEGPPQDVVLQNSENTYLITKNPLYAWHAYLESRRYHRESNEEARQEAIKEGLDPETWVSEHKPHEWILSYFDSCATQLVRAAFSDRAGKTPAAIVAEALGFKRPGRSGRGNSFDDFAGGKKLSRLILGARVFLLVIDDGHKPDFAAESVARTQGVHRSTAARAYSEHAQLFPQINRGATVWLDVWGVVSSEWWKSRGRHHSA